MHAAAAVIVYHAIAFWIPSLGGLIGYALLRRREARAAIGRDPVAGEIHPTVTRRAEATVT